MTELVKTRQNSSDEELLPCPFCERIVDLLEMLYARGYTMFGEDKEIERLIKELRETDESLKTTRIVSKERDEEDRAQRTYRLIDDFYARYKEIYSGYKETKR